MAIKPKVSDEANDVLRPEDMQDKTKVTPKPMPKPKPKMSDAEESVKNDMLAGEMVYPTVKKKNGGMVKSGASRGDGCAVRGRTKGRMV